MLPLFRLPAEILFRFSLSDFFNLRKSKSRYFEPKFCLVGWFGRTSTFVEYYNNAIRDSGAPVSFLKKFSEQKLVFYAFGSSNVAETAAHEVRTKCFEEGSVWLEMQLLKKYASVKGKNDTMLFIGQTCNNNNIVVSTKKNTAELNRFSIAVDGTLTVVTGRRCNN